MGFARAGCVAACLIFCTSEELPMVRPSEEMPLQPCALLCAPPAAAGVALCRGWLAAVLVLPPPPLSQLMPQPLLLLVLGPSSQCPAALRRRTRSAP